MQKMEYSKNLVDNCTNLTRRLIIKDRIGGSKNSYLLMMMVSRLSLIHHAYYYLYKYAAQQKKFVAKKEITNLMQVANEMFSLLFDSFYKKNLDKAHEIGVLKEKHLTGTTFSLLEKSKGPENVILYHLGEIIRMIQMESTNIFGLVDLNID